MKKINLPQTVKEQKAWCKRLGIRRLEVAEMAVYRDSLADKAIKAIVRRDYEGAAQLLKMAEKAHYVVEVNQDTLDAIDKACR